MKGAPLGLEHRSGLYDAEQDVTFTNLTEVLHSIFFLVIAVVILRGRKCNKKLFISFPENICQSFQIYSRLRHSLQGHD